MSDHKDFFVKMSPYAAEAAAALHMPIQVILAQWALESAYGTSSLCQRANNYAGIKYTSYADGKSGSYAAYDSIQSFTKDYIRVLNSSYYDQVRAASGVGGTISALAASPYAGDSQYGQKLREIIKNENIPTSSLNSSGSGVGAALLKVLANPLLWMGAALWFIFKD